MTVLEPDVTLTDYGLTILCTVLAVLINRHGARDNLLRPWFVAFFATIGLASAAGGTVHGFFPDETSIVSGILWFAAMIALGGTAVSAWAIGARLLFAEGTARWVIRVAGGVFTAYLVFVLFVSHLFVVAIAHYVPAIVFLLAALSILYRRTRRRHLRLGLLGLALMLVAAAVQRLGIGIHPTYFNHNALYHVIQAAALILFSRAGSGLVRPATA